MRGVRIAKGILRMAANNGTPASTIKTPMMLPVYMLAMSPHTKSGFSVKSSGPGCRPQMIKPPSMTAAVGEPGMPSVIIGSMTAAHAAGVAAMLPMITLGIPGSPTAAVMLGGLIIWGLQHGTRLQAPDDHAGGLDHLGLAAGSHAVRGK